MFVAAPRAMVVDASAGVDVVCEVDGWDRRMGGWIDEQVQLFAPPGFPFEMANALLVARREPAHQVRARMRALQALEITIPEGHPEHLLDTVLLADRHGLTVYDAAYLQLAIHLEAELATRDKALARAARAEGLVVHD